MAGSLLLTCGVVCVVPRAAHADPSLGSATAQAKALTADVARLELQAEIASQKYDAAEERLGEVTTAYLSAEERSGQLSQDQAQQTAVAMQRIRYLYMSGGELGLYAQALNGTNINDVLDELVSVSHVINADAAAIRTTGSGVAAANAEVAALNSLADQRTTYQTAAALAQAQVLGLLQEQQQALSSANALVRQLVAQQQAEQAAAEEAQAAGSLAIASSAPTTLPPGTPAAVVTAITAAETKVGDPYVYAATGPNAFDCSGLTQWAYRQAGIDLPRTAAEQWFSSTMHPALSQLEPGDLLFYATDLSVEASIHHVTMYIGDGYMIEAPHTGAFVHITPVYLDGYYGATRPVDGNGVTALLP
jgi:peptidoglycan DL-endopeptidase CwlO